jgi:hypothetical protein
VVRWRPVGRINVVLGEWASCGVEDYGLGGGGVGDGLVIVLCDGRGGGRGNHPATGR